MKETHIHIYIYIVYVYCTYIRRPHWRRACGTIGQLDMKVKVTNQVSLKGEPPFPHGPNLGPYAPLRVRLPSVRLG